MFKSGGVDPKALLKLLYEWEEVDKETAQKIFSLFRKGGLDIVAACIENGVRGDAVMGAVARLLGMEMVQLSGLVLPKVLIDKVPSNVAHTPHRAGAHAGERAGGGHRRPRQPRRTR